MITDKKVERQRRLIERQTETIKELNMEIATLERDKLFLQNKLDEQTALLNETMSDIEAVRSDYLEMLSQMSELRENYKKAILEINKAKKEYGKQAKELFKDARKNL